MILTWMLAATLFGLLVGVAARAAEAALRLKPRQGRAPWVAAIGVSLVWPVLVPFVSRPNAVRLSSVVVNDGAVQTIARRLPALPPGIASRLDPWLIAMWAIATIFLVARLLLAQRALMRISSAAHSAEIDGHAVLITDGLGPAVIGIAAPKVAVPAWLAELDAPLRELVLRHEREHCRSRDTALLWFGELAAALIPWNPAVWWQARRLRLALELDCDARTLRGVRTPSTYAQLLLLIAQRQQLTHIVPMLAESNSHLSRRIRAVTRDPVRNARPKAALLGLIATAAVVAACSPRVSSALAVPGPAFGATSSVRSRATGVTLQGQRVAPAISVPGSPAPRYPDLLKTAGVEGEVVVMFVVDTNGTADLGTLKIVKSSHQLFTNALKNALPQMRFRPAVLNGRKVRQLVSLPIVFNLAGSAKLAFPDTALHPIIVTGVPKQPPRQ